MYKIMYHNRILLRKKMVTVAMKSAHQPKYKTGEWFADEGKGAAIM